jgi:serpin B
MTRLGLAFALALVLALPGAPATAGPPATPPTAATAARASNALGSDLLPGGGNAALSPWSVWSALSMAYAGSSGQTRAQMTRVLHVKRLRGRTGRANAALLAALKSSAKKSGATLEGANALWGATDARFRKRFLATLRRDYGAPLERVDFRADPNAAREQINTWVADHTGGRIKDLFGPANITSSTRLALANALYFKARWLTQFDPEQTSPAPFHAAGGDVDVPTMSLDSTFGYARLPDLQAVALPYRGQRLSMLVVLPDPGKLRAVESELRTGRIARALEPTALDLSLPRFRVATKLDLADPLSKLGMPRAFGDLAEFPRISPTESLKIQAVVHQAWIQVGEKGTEAAAATGISFDPTAAAPAPKRLSVDRPFLFAVRDDATGAVLFLGRVENPAEAG